MSVKERIKAIQLIENVKKHPDYAQNIGIKITMRLKDSKDMEGAYEQNNEENK